MFIKRIQKLVGGGYRLHSDNKDNYDPQDISEDICQNAKFIGRFIRTIHIETINL
ncbi:MAG: S24 family peptidase [Haemophilus parainfluenzae]|nr:S24 family peptidase [Haemophilus parainfluenzae]